MSNQPQLHLWFIYRAIRNGNWSRTNVFEMWQVLDHDECWIAAKKLEGS